MTATARATRKGERRPAPSLPIARIYVDVGLPHLDRTFDYRVADTQHDDAVVGCRVRVRFAGQLVDGYLVERADTTDHTGRLAYLERVVSPEPVLSPEIATLARAVADKYAGTMVDVLRLAIPPRHAKVEKEAVSDVQDAVSGTPDAVSDVQDAVSGTPDAVSDGWGGYRHGAALLTALGGGARARAVWQALPGEDWPARLAEAATAVAASGRGTVIVVPDYRDVARLHAACAAQLGEQQVVALSADLGPAERYRRWLRVRRGIARVVVGTRAAMFAPMTDLGLLVVWDDGDDLHAEPRAPYPHVRDVLVQRAHLSGASLLVAGFARTAEAQLLVESGWAHPVVPDRASLRARAPRVTGFGEDFDLARDEAARAARLPAVAFEVARAALKNDAPVLVQVPRRGYVPSLACGSCRTQARCRRCAGPLAVPAGQQDGHQDVARAPACRWCGVPESRFRCSACGSAQLRAQVIGARRTAEELGRAFPGVAVRTSGGTEVLAHVDGSAALVIATPGAEPVASGGYGAALLLDGWALLGRQDLRAGEETLRRWMTAAALVRPGEQGGRVIVGADVALVPVQALIRWDPAWHAERELAERRELGFPPAVRMASLEGEPEPLAAALDEVTLPESAEVLGPVPVMTPPRPDRHGEQRELERVLLRVPNADGKALAAALAALQAGRGARKEPDTVRVRLDPLSPI
ncbi:primosomal protein N' [Haloechinothrix halophila]|uniref:primosomal protein N' n=1 Tax=Haloechinothrix halophila TaxID=1069073 RepID=UPI00041FD363|nr:primosomal protein N' [Haloechinothrix halophila]